LDIHPREPWVLAALYDGNVYIWNYQTQALVKSFEVLDLPGTVSYHDHHHQSQPAEEREREREKAKKCIFSFSLPLSRNALN
jgi:hypothetical protein